MVSPVVLFLIFDCCVALVKLFFCRQTSPHCFQGYTFQTHAHTTYTGLVFFINCKYIHACFSYSPFTIFSFSGLSQITLCFSPEVPDAFYLCHVCEQQCLLHTILGHIFHGDHYSNYFVSIK